jgi:hypothetical protein
MYEFLREYEYGGRGMNGSKNPLIRAITERTMEEIINRKKIDTSLYNVIYVEVQRAIKIALDSKQEAGE